MALKSQQLSPASWVLGCSMDHTTQLFSFYRRHAGVGTQSPVTLEKPLPLSCARPTSTPCFMVIKHCSALSQAPQVPGLSPTYILKFRSTLPDAQRDKNNKGDARFLFFILIKKKVGGFHAVQEQTEPCLTPVSHLHNLVESVYFSQCEHTSPCFNICFPLGLWQGRQYLFWF